MSLIRFTPLLFAGTLAGLPAGASANTLYKCTDAAGGVLYTNQKTANKNCIVLSVQLPPPPPREPGATRVRSAPTPTPTDFPRVSEQQQSARDSDRRAILERELATERGHLDSAKRTLADAAKAAGGTSMQAAKDAIALHERNIDALTREMGKLR